MTIQFQVGQKYSFTFIGDSELHVCYEVLKRTAKTITITDGRETKRCKIKSYGESEFVNPDGRYSMAPTLYADNPTPDRDLGAYRTGMGV